jgi:hypothetical protein
MFAQVIERAGELQDILGKWTRSSAEDATWDYTLDQSGSLILPYLSNAVKTLMDQALVAYGWKQPERVAGVGTVSTRPPQKRGKAVAFEA